MKSLNKSKTTFKISLSIQMTKRSCMKIRFNNILLRQLTWKTRTANITIATKIPLLQISILCLLNAPESIKRWNPLQLNYKITFKSPTLSLSEWMRPEMTSWRLASLELMILLMLMGSSFSTSISHLNTLMSHLKYYLQPLETEKLGSILIFMITVTSAFQSLERGVGATLVRTGTRKLVTWCMFSCPSNLSLWQMTYISMSQAERLASLLNSEWNITSLIRT